MPTARLAPDLDMHYRVDDFTDPWTSPETILLLHGNAESGASWYRWYTRRTQALRLATA